MKRLHSHAMNWLSAFEAAARHMSFAGGAKELNLSPGAVSYQVKQLERALGAQLFTRQARRLVLTDDGIRYLPVVRRAFDHLAASTEELFGEAADSTVVLLVTISLTYLWLVPRLGRFRRKHPDITIRLISNVEGFEIGADGIDLEIRYGSGDWPGTRSERLFSESLFPVCSPAVLKRDPPLTVPADLRHHDIIHMVGEPENWQTWLQAAGVRDMPLFGGLQFDVHMMATQAAISGMGVTLGLSPLVADALADGTLVAPFDLQISARDAHFLVIPEEAAPGPAAEAFKDWLLEEAGGGR